MVREAYGNDVTKLDLSSETVRPTFAVPHFLPPWSTSHTYRHCVTLLAGQVLMVQKGHFDIPRARKGKMGGFFWSM